MRQNEVLLIFPPVDCRVCDKPYWELGYVSSYLRARDYQTTFLDLNLGLFEHLFLPEEVDKMLDSQSSLINPNSTKDRKWMDSLHSARDQLLHNLDLVRGRLGIPSYEKYKKALNNLDFLLEVFFQDDFPEHLKLNGYLPLQTDIMSGKQLFKDVLSDNVSTISKYYDALFPGLPMDNSPDLMVLWINYYYQLYPGLLLCREWRRHFSQVPICIVSNLLARNTSVLKDYPEFSKIFDVLISSDPEVVIPELLSWVNGRLSLNKIPNSGFFSGNGFYLSHEKAQSDLNILQTPHFPPASEKRYFYPIPVFDIIGTRGCRYSQCVFCDDIGFAGYNKAPHRMRQPNRVVEDIRNLAKQHDCDSFLFWDNFLTPEFLEGLTDEMHKKNLDVIWGGHTRVESVLREDFCERLYQNGCRFLNLGFESASPRILMQMKKGASLDEMEKALHNCSSHGIAVHCSFIQGFPGETPVERLETATFIEKNLSMISSFHIYDFALPQFSIMSRHPDQFGVGLFEKSNDCLDVDRTFYSMHPSRHKKYFDLTSLSQKYPNKQGDRVIYEITCQNRQHLSVSHE